MSAENRWKVILAGFLCLACGVGSLWGQIRGGMLNPAIDTPGKPFSYFWHPTDVIGALYDPVASEVTPEGYIYTGFGELMFFVGNPPEPVNQRIKTLYHGYLPIVQYRLKRHGVQYRFRMFATDLGGGLQGLPVNFVEVRLRNEAAEERSAFVSSAYRFSPPNGGLSGMTDYRFRQRFDLIPAAYTEGQTTFDSHWAYSFGPDALIRDGRLLYVFPDQPQPAQMSLSLEDNGLRMYRFFSGQVKGNPNPTYRLDPHTPMGMVLYRIWLKPGESQSLVFKMPIAPIPEGTAEAQQVQKAGYGDNLERTASFWEGFVGKSPPLRFPETKVQQALLANTIFNLLAIDKVGNDYILRINKFQYHYFYGSTAHMLVALDYLDLSDVAGKAALYSVKIQSPEGAFVFRDDTATRHYWSAFGVTLWGWGRHYLLTRDSSFLHKVYPSVLRAMNWEKMVTGEDPLGLMPVFGVADDAGLWEVHQTGQDMWTLVGIRNAIAMARGMGRSQDVERFTGEYRRFWKAFQKQLAIQTAKTGGYIPPALDRTLKGNNWDNLLTLFPEPLFAPFDPRVTATIEESRKTYSEGILGYTLPRAIAKNDDHFVFDTARRLHYWHSLDNAENELVRDDPKDQELAVKDLYAMLLHTTSTHATQEFGTYPWSTRDYVGIDRDILPDGVTSAVLIELMRNMLVREYHNDLYLFSALSPDWLRPGQQIAIREEPSVFGPVNATLTAAADGWSVQLSNQFRSAPEHVVITIPWFYEADEVEADGHRAQVTDGKLILPPEVHEVQVRGRIKPGIPAMSYESTVQDYKREYNRRYEEFLRTGSTRP